MGSNNQIYTLLKNYKDKLDIIRGNSIEKILLTLKSNTDYDNLFLNEVKKLNVDLTNIKDKCIDEILKTYYNATKILCDKTYYHKFMEMEVQELTLIIEDYFRIKEINCNNSNFRTIIHSLDEELAFYLFQEKNKNDVIDELFSENDSLSFLNALFMIETKEKRNIIKLLLSARFYQMVSYYLIYDFDSDLNQNYYEVDEIDYNIYEALDNVESLSQVLNIFDLFKEKIVSSYMFFINLSKQEKETIINNIVECNKIKKLFNIFPYLIFEYNSYFNLKFKSDDLKSVNAGIIVLSIVEDSMKQAYDGNLEFNEIYLKSVELLIASNKDINVSKTFKFIASNVYENICIKRDIDSEEREYIKLIECTKDYEKLLDNLDLLSWIIYKFYTFNGDFFSEDILKDLRNKVSEKNKVYLKRLNPYYLEEEKYLK